VELVGHQGALKANMANRSGIASIKVAPSGQ